MPQVAQSVLETPHEWAHAGSTRSESVPVETVSASAYTIPVDPPESDGTLEWDSHTIVLVEVSGAGRTGLGYSYTHTGAADVVTDKLAGVVTGRNALDVGGAWAAMWHAVRNLGTTGLVSMAISAVDIALWDLKARLLDVPLVVALDAVHEEIPIYGSGGFCSYSDDRLAEQLGGWVRQGVPRVKMKVGRDPDVDRHRLDVARAAIGGDAELFVDANGAYGRAQALQWADIYAGYGVRWFEEPVSSDDLDGLRLIRDRAPGGLAVAAGEYGREHRYPHPYVRSIPII